MAFWSLTWPWQTQARRLTAPLSRPVNAHCSSPAIRVCPLGMWLFRVSLREPGGRAESLPTAEWAPSDAARQPTAARSRSSEAIAPTQVD
ncbi:MAG: hypothetical protein WDW38_008897 [Sanguina aurantia]